MLSGQILLRAARRLMHPPARHGTLRLPPTKACTRACCNGALRLVWWTVTKSNAGSYSSGVSSSTASTASCSLTRNEPAHCRNCATHGKASTSRAFHEGSGTSPVTCRYALSGHYLYGKNGFSTCSEDSDTTQTVKKSIKSTDFSKKMTTFAY